MQKVWIFGIGKTYKEREKYIKSHFEIVGYLDNQAVLGRNDQFNSLPLYNPADIEQYIKNEYPILLMSKNYVDMCYQLCSYGVQQKRILFGIMLYPLEIKEKVLFEDGRYLGIENNNIVYYWSQDKKRLIQTQKEIENIAEELTREKYQKEYPLIKAIANMPLEPVSRSFGMDRGKAIDRYFIENFLECNKKLIHGKCLEIADNTYTKRMGGAKMRILCPPC